VKENKPPKTLSRTKRILFPIFPAVVFCLLLIGVEAGLRLISPTPHLVQRITYDGRTWDQVNRSYLAKYFPAWSDLIPDLKPTLLAVEREPGSLRVLCIGGSSMFGTPYEMNANIPAILRKQLRHLYPDREVEVINLGASAINTNVIADLAPAMARLAPDLVVLYAGHNEFYGPDGVGASWLEKKLPSLVRLKYTMRDLASVRWIQSQLRSFWLSRRRSSEKNLMRQVSAGALVRLKSEEADRIFTLFEQNLERILQTFRHRKIPLLVCDVASNLLFPPFAADSVSGLDVADTLLARGHPEQAERMLRSMLAVDSSNAFVDYRLGRAALAQTREGEAKRWLEKARDEDLLKFRAPSRINRIIHETCLRLSVPCVSADSALDSASPHGITGETLFWEHLHPRAEGYYQIAGLMLRAIQRDSLLRPPPAGRALLPFNTDSLSIPWLDLAFADLSIRGLTGRWPFVHFSTPMAVFPHADTMLQRIALSVYQKSLGWNEGCLATALRFKALEQIDEAATTYKALLEEYPQAYLTRYLLAQLLRDSGRLPEAIAQYRRCITTMPTYPFARVDLGLLLINQGMFEEAQEHLRTALSLAAKERFPPGLAASAHYGLAAIEANLGRYREALQEADSAIHLSPTYEPAQILRGRIAQAARDH
jgi:tetratricopeptide (TPR) repeat protein